MSSEIIKADRTDQQCLPKINQPNFRKILQSASNKKYSQLTSNPNYYFVMESTFGVVLLEARDNIFLTSVQEIHTVFKIIIGGATSEMPNEVVIVSCSG